MEFPEFVRMTGIDVWGAVIATFPDETFDVEWEDGETSTLSMPYEGRTWARFLSRSVVNECLDIVRAWTRDNAATAYDPGHEGPYWVISLEGGPYQWPYEISISDAVQWPAGVRVGAVNHFALGLHAK